MLAAARERSDLKVEVHVVRHESRVCRVVGERRGVMLVVEAMTNAGQGVGWVARWRRTFWSYQGWRRVVDGSFRTRGVRYVCYDPVDTSLEPLAAYPQLTFVVKYSHIKKSASPFTTA